MGAALTLLFLVDFRPTAYRQLVESEVALANTRGAAAAVRWAWLVRGKVVGEIMGLALALRAPCAGACAVLVSHLLFWLCGAGRSRVGADGQSAPLPPQVARVIASADAVVLAFAALGALGTTTRLRAIGATGFTTAALLVSAEQVPKLIAKLRELPAVRSFFADVAAKQAEIARQATSSTPPSSPPSPPPRSPSPRAPPPQTVEQGLGKVGVTEAKDAVLASLTSRNPRAVEDDDVEDAGVSLWAAQWWPLCFAAHTTKTAPIATKLLGAPLVVWWDGTGEAWRCTLDRCSHRMAPLSEGRLSGGCLECPYHGWAFSGDGSC